MFTVNINFNSFVPVGFRQAPLHAIASVPPDPHILLCGSIQCLVTVQSFTQVAKGVIYLRVIGYIVNVGPPKEIVVKFRSLHHLMYYVGQIVRVHFPGVDV